MRVLRLRLESEVSLLASQGQESLGQGEGAYLQPIVQAAMLGLPPNIRQAMITDANGRVLASSDPRLNGKDVLTRFEKKQLDATTGSKVFRVPGGTRGNSRSHPHSRRAQRLRMGL